MAKLLKELYSEEYIDILSNSIVKNYKDFDKKSFKVLIFSDTWQKKELKKRIRHISTTLYKFLPQDYKRAIAILKDTFNQIGPKFYLENLIFQDFVEVYGLDDFETSMDALKTFTINSSSEFAIREFILRYPKRSILQMKRWAKSKNEHIRRLSSEGCRPRLPWATVLEKFKEDPRDILDILDILKKDDSLYVRKSVANNLNDISKDNPQIVKDIANQWINKDKKTDWILKHGCRTLLKNGDKEILKIFGFDDKNIAIKSFDLTKIVKLGEKLEFSFTLFSSEDLGKLRVEYVIDFVRKSGRYSKKIFKISEGNYKQKSKDFSKSYSFKPISSRNYYTGRHYLSIVINGAILDKKEFKLIDH